MRYFKLCPLLITLLVSLNVRADWQFTSSLTAEIEAFDRKSNDNSSIENESLSFIPRVAGVYSSSTLTSGISFEHINAHSNDEDVVKSRSYTNSSASLNARLLANAITISGSSSQRYQVRDPSQLIGASLQTNPNSFSKVNSEQIAATLSIPNPKTFGLSVSLGANQSKSELIEGTALSGSLDSKTKSGAISFYRGKAPSFLDWNISANQQKTERLNYGDYKSDSIHARVSFPLFKQLRFVLTGTKNDNEIGEGANAVSINNSLNQESIGAGLEWRSSKTNYIIITYNNSERSLPSSTNIIEDDFIGVDLSWALSNKTNITANAGQKPYGDSYGLSINHKSRHITTQVRYSEEYTAFSRLGQNTENSTFVCPVGALGFEDCFQPEFGYELLPGEQSFDFQTSTPELTEQIILRKMGNISFSWSLRKLTLGVGASSGTSEYVETSGSREDKSITAFSSYNLGRNTNINWNASWSDNQGDSIVIGGGINGISKSTAIGFSRTLGKHLSTAVNLRYINRESDSETQSYEDKRISASIIYQF